MSFYSFFKFKLGDVKKLAWPPINTRPFKNYVYECHTKRAFDNWIVTFERHEGSGSRPCDVTKHHNMRSTMLHTQINCICIQFLSSIKKSYSSIRAVTCAKEIVNFDKWFLHMTGHALKWYTHVDFVTCASAGSFVILLLSYCNLNWIVGFTTV